MDSTGSIRYIRFRMKAESKQKLLLVLRLSISAGLVWFIFRQVSSREDLGGLFNYYAGASYWWLAGAAALLLLLLAAGSWRWGILLAAQGIRLSPLSVFMYYMIGFFFNNLLPTTVGGDVVKVVYLKRSMGRGAAAVVSVVLDRIMGIAGLVAVAFVALLLGAGRLAAHPETEDFVLPLYLLMVGLVAGIALFFTLGFSRAPAEILFRLIRWPRLRAKVENVYRTFSLLREKPAVLFRTFVISIGIWILIVMISWMVYMTFRSPGGAPAEWSLAAIPVQYFFLFIPAISVASSLPVTFAGWGTREAFFVLLFSSLPGISGLDALFLSLNFYFIFLANALLGGIVYIFKDQLRFHREDPSAPAAAGFNTHGGE